MKTKMSLVLAAVLALSACKSEEDSVSSGTPSEVKPSDAPATAPSTAPAKTGTSAQAPGAAGSEWASTIRRGAEFTAAEEVALAQVLGAPQEYAGKTFKTRGVVARACSKKGCWMELQPEGADKGVRVTFKDYKFFVPLDSEGAKAVVEGTMQIKKLTKEDAEHLESEGAKIARNADGEAIEVAMVATAVELDKN